MVRRQCGLGYNYLFHIFVLLLCFQNICCHGMHFLSELAKDHVHCSSCASYRGLSMTSHLRRTHLDIFCKLCFAPGYLWKNTQQFSAFFPNPFSADKHSPEPSFHCYHVLRETFRIFSFHSIRQR